MLFNLFSSAFRIINQFLAENISLSRRIFALWNNELIDGRSIWDQIAVLFAARPFYFVTDSHGALEKNSKSETYGNP